jgi:orotate phosphoribosyltransferase
MRSKLKKLIKITEEAGAFKTGNFLLSSGKKSNIYFDGRIITLLPESLRIISELMFEVVVENKINIIAGPTLGADAIIAGTLMVAAEKKHNLSGAIVRKETKAHGTGNQVEGNYKENDRVLVVDDTCTTGGSVLFASKVLETHKCNVIKIMCVVDRVEGGREKIEKSGYRFGSLLMVKNKKLVF